MIYVFSDEGRLYLAENEAEVCDLFSGIRILEEDLQFFAENGSRFKAVFDVPVKEIHFFWMWYITLDAGKYHLEPTSPDPTEPLWSTVLETEWMEPNPYFASLEDAKYHLAMNGADIRNPYSPHLSEN